MVWPYLDCCGIAPLDIAGVDRAETSTVRSTPLVDRLNAAVNLANNTREREPTHRSCIVGQTRLLSVSVYVPSYVQNVIRIRSPSRDGIPFLLEKIYSNLNAHLHPSSGVSEILEQPEDPERKDSAARMASGYLKVEGDKIVDGNGKSIILRGAAIGGWMKSVSLPGTTIMPCQRG